MSWNTRRDFRKIHRWGSIIIAVPFLVVLVTGIILQLKKDIAWIQPETMEGVASEPSISFETILEASKLVPEAEISGWEDINRLDLRPGDGVVKVRANNHWEIQIDIQTGAILQSTYRRSDIIEAIHDGSWFHDLAKLWIFLPNGIIVTVLWITGMYLFFVPYLNKRRNQKRMIKLKQESVNEENPL
jgi:uncharacterized iron-regulated membrane protein